MNSFQFYVVFFQQQFSHVEPMEGLYAVKTMFRQLGGFYVLFNSISGISGQWKAVGNVIPFKVEKISPRAGLELGPLDQ